MDLVLYSFVTCRSVYLPSVKAVWASQRPFMLLFYNHSHCPLATPFLSQSLVLEIFFSISKILWLAIPLHKHEIIHAFMDQVYFSKHFCILKAILQGSQGKRPHFSSGNKLNSLKLLNESPMFSSRTMIEIQVWHLVLDFLFWPDCCFSREDVELKAPVGGDDTEDHLKI